MPDLTILSSIRGRSLGIGMPGGELLLLYWVAHLWWGGQGMGLGILILLWSGVEHSRVARSTLPYRGTELGWRRGVLSWAEVG